MNNKSKELLKVLKEFRDSQVKIASAISSLEVVIGSDAFYDSTLGEGIAAFMDSAYTAIEVAYGLPQGDIEWLESIKWDNKDTLYVYQGIQYLVTSLEDYVEVVCG